MGKSQNLLNRSRWQRWSAALEQKLMPLQWRSGLMEFALMAVDPLLSQAQLPAKVVAIEHEDKVSHLWLRATTRWAWPKPGQFVSLFLEHHGETLQRCYSVSGMDKEADLFRLSIAKLERGLFSSQLVPALAPGDQIKISPATGDFVLPAKPRPLFLCAAGSGVTPMLPLAAAALGQGQAVHLLSIQRAAEPMLWAEWQQLQADYPQLLRCECWDTASQARLNVEQLQARLAQQPEQTELYICAGQGLRQQFQAAAEAAGFAPAQLHMESFYQQAAPVSVSEDAAVVAKVNLSDGRAIAVRQGQTILQAAQAAGVRMQHCCGQGVCRSCETRKVSGVVENIQTGLKQLKQGEWILPCISLPLGDVELA